MSSTTTYLISGTSRGIGRGLVSSLLLRADTTIFAGVRDPTAKAAQDLLSLPRGTNSNIHLVKLNASSETDANNVVASLQQDHGTSHLHIVIAKAGILSNMALVSSVTLSSIREHFEINTLGPISLFQASLPLLQKATNPKCVVTTSGIGSNTIAPSLPAPVAAYGVSKAAVNWFFSRAHGEHDDITFIPIHPGLVETDMSGPFVEHVADAKVENQIKAISVEESVKGYLNVVDKATREKDSGKFVQWDGEGLPW